MINMTIYLLNSDARQIPLADQSVQCIITSPPYYGLRDYGTAQWDGGDPMCDHVASERYYTEKTAAVSSSEAFSEPGEANKARIKAGRWRESGYCTKCGAIRIDKQIGLERTPQEYVASIVSVMRECWRVLKNDGVLWLNLGDTYAANRGYQVAQTIDSETKRANAGQFNNMAMNVPDGLKPKDLIGIPWRVAFALQNDGWYLRSDIIWSKPNPMPESVTDRPTKAHEYIFLLTKRARYYYDAAAIAESYTESSINRFEYDFTGYDTKGDPTGKILGRASDPHGGLKNSKGKDTSHGRNRRSVWTVATMPYSGAHFATFPPKLIEPMILAGSRPGDLILDPFAGTATVGRVAIKHQRRFVGLDLNLKYIGDLAKERTSKVQTYMQFATEP